jgi:5'(3')-deoxyribonucleotidase
MIKYEKKVEIGCDFDMVLNDWEAPGSPFLSLWNELLPDVPFKYAKQSDNWEVSWNYPEELRNLIRTIYVNPKPGYYADMPLMEGAPDGMEKLMKIGNVSIVTVPILEVPHELEEFFGNSLEMRDNTWARVIKEKKFWLRKHFGKDAPQIYPLDRKYLFAGDFLIDDCPSVATKAPRPVTWKHILFDRGYKYNKGLIATKGDWSTIPTKIEQFLAITAE